MSEKSIPSAPTTQGGKREGAGRKKGWTKEGPKTVTFSASILPDDLARLDVLRGSIPRGQYIASLLPKA